MNDDFQTELWFSGVTPSRAFVQAPEGNGVAERFTWIIKEQVLWVRTFQTVEELRLALHEWLLIYIMSSGWSSGMGFAHQLKCAAISSRLRRPRDDAESPSNQNDRRRLA